MSSCTNCINWRKDWTWNQKSELDETWKHYIEEKSYTVVETWECEQWKLYKTDVSVKKDLTENSTNKPTMRQDELLDKINSRTLCWLHKASNQNFRTSKTTICIVPLIFNKTNVCRRNIGPMLKEYAEKEVLKPQQQRMLIFSSELTNCSTITPLLLFYLELGLIWIKFYCFVEYRQSSVLTTSCNLLSIFIVTATRIRTPNLLQKL